MVKGVVITMWTRWAEFYKTNREMVIESGIATIYELPGLQKESDE